MIVLALDTATPATVAAVERPGAQLVCLRHDPVPGERPRHGELLLALAHQALGELGIAWAELDRIGVGVGPGGFTGLRIGVATARGLAQGAQIPVVAISTLRALAAGVDGAQGSAGRPVLAVSDARRGEVFAAGWDVGGANVLAPGAYPPDALAARASALADPPVAVGDGALRYRAVLQAAGVTVPDDDDEAHRLSGAALCRLAAAASPMARDLLLPDYQREPDAKPPRLP